MTVWRRLGRAGPLLAILLVAGCSYFNGIYNARGAARRGDKALRQGKEEEAAGSFAMSSVVAESVLARYRRSHWRDEAMYLAGRGAALSDQCDRATRRLAQFLDSPSRDAFKRDQSTIALAACDVKQTRYLDALGRLEPLLGSKDKNIAAPAALWSARASIAMGRTDDAGRFLAMVGVGSAQWELASASMARQEYTRAESLLALRGAQGDYRDELLAWLRDLWRADQRAAVEAIAARYDRARMSTRDKVRLHMAVADLEIGDHMDTLARGHLLTARRLTTDTTIDREADARLTLLAIGQMSQLVDVVNAINRLEEKSRGSVLQRRLSDNLLLVNLLAGATDVSGASLFLAGEIARDSLRSPALAHTLFTRVVATLPATLMAPRALLAAGAVLPDSAEVYTERVRTRYPRSVFNVLLDGRDPGTQPAYRAVEESLRQAWAKTMLAWTDTLTRLHPPAPGTATQPATGAAGPPVKPPELLP